METVVNNLHQAAALPKGMLPTEKTWLDKELLCCQFKDARLGKRFRTLIKQLSDGMGESIPLVCQDWANTKAAYRFFSNNRVSEKEILDGHFQATYERFFSNRKACTNSSRYDRIFLQTRKARAPWLNRILL
ncbi:MAG: hypothetical protein BGO67_10455 [Alphaproteobacteria bacterium 41-28]|nr:MAG: hypothetical protein BGO67_10455 [Alphaproteobacteria bacterium 41-28]